jgi:hypothetical protein
MICPANPILTEDFRVVQKEKFLVALLHVRNIHLRKGQAYSWETNPSSRQRECCIRIITARVQLKKKVWSWVSRSLTTRGTDWRQAASRKITLTSTLESVEFKAPAWQETGQIELKNWVQFWRVGSPRLWNKKWQEDFIAVWSDSCCIINPLGRAIAQAVIRWFPTASVWVQTRV